LSGDAGIFEIANRAPAEIIWHPALYAGPPTGDPCFAKILDWPPVSVEKPWYFLSAESLELAGSFQLLCEHLTQFRRQWKFSDALLARFPWCEE